MEKAGKQFLEEQIELLKKSIQQGVVTKDSSLLDEQKEIIIQMIGKEFELMGMQANLCQIGAEVDKRFAEEFD